MEALIKFGAQGCVPSRWAWFIVNALENRYNPVFKPGGFTAWSKRGILPLLDCVN